MGTTLAATKFLQEWGQKEDESEREEETASSLTDGVTIPAASEQ